MIFKWGGILVAMVTLIYRNSSDYLVYALQVQILVGLFFLFGMRVLILVLGGVTVAMFGGYMCSAAQLAERAISSYILL